MSNREMNNFEQIITSIRNILRVEGITGLDSINHCVAFLVCRYLTVEKCTEFNIPLEFAFENFLKNEDGSLCDDHTAIGKFYNEDITKDCLFVHLREVLNFKSFKFKISAPLNFLNIYKKLDGININDLFDKIDIVGAIYELHLKTGTTGSGMRDLGQYFTNREVIKYMIKLCNPKLKKNGDIESILDPSMGTGGFLSMSIKYLNKNFKNINWKINKKRIYGFDVDETVKNMSILNALLECGQIFDETFVKNDTLKNDYKISDNILIDKVDIILANEPFGLKNIIHKDVCKRIKDLKIEGTKAEPLFLQLMMQSLNIDGRCAVIVPDGVLFNDAKLHKLTRKYLCDNLRLAKVISLEDGLFLNTGVKSSILFFVNDGKTQEVDFCKIKLSNGEIVEELIIKVDIEEIEKNDFSLFVNKYNKVEEDKIEGIEYKKLGDILTKKPGKSLSRDKIITGNYPVIGGGESVSGYHNDFNYNEPLIFVARVGSAGSISYYTDKCYVTDLVGAFSVNKSIIFKYVFYIMKFNEINIKKLNKQTGAPSINLSDMLETIEIPIPPLSLQQQIVEALDSIYDTIEGNNKLIQNYDKIKKGIIWSNTLNVQKKKLDIICNIKFGTRIKRDEVEADEKSDKKYPCYGGGGISFYMNEFNREGNNLVISRFGVSEKCVRIIDDKFWLNDSGMTINSKDEKCIQQYLNYIIFLKQKDIYNLSVGACQKNININDFKNLEIPIPSKEVQEFIVKECDYYNNIIDTLKKENERLQNNKIIDIVLKSVSTSVQNESLIINNTNSNSNNKDKKQENIEEDDLTEQIEKFNEIIESVDEDLEEVKPKIKKLTKKSTKKSKPNDFK
jgi:type I restriction-modification system DNA methylase subunit